MTERDAGRGDEVVLQKRDCWSEVRRDDGAVPEEPIARNPKTARLRLVKRGPRGFGWAARRKGLSAELRDPAFCFLLVIGGSGRSQVPAQSRHHLLVLSRVEVNLREHEAGIGDGIFNLAEHVNRFWSDAVLSD